ncbi:Transcriptional regulator, contains XRE-family HTH domain [Cohaesibacter marisflavi]|uniref:Transcriptional regulator, contains XRE-family HTH domain n=1 Tax=Cohaesibacter marisflavi TaxID=655353 RepID=A0A1I5JWT0_9HYPH|nr:helix-turn-helix transcriptional regulator [Cohaesibacter marisflavi]SFO77237.1 Transcriptional regulator, contains XRE-family HTH domain [Cohaesibacter marisflavi]
MKKSPNEYDAYVGARVRMARSIAGISQEKLGEHLDITFQQIQKYEKGSNRISASKLVEISHALNKPISWFFEDIENNSKGDDGLETAFQSPLGSRLLRTFYQATNEQRKMIADLAATVVGGNQKQSAPAE